MMWTSLLTATLLIPASLFLIATFSNYLIISWFFLIVLQFEASYHEHQIDDMGKLL